MSNDRKTGESGCKETSRNEATRQQHCWISQGDRQERRRASRSSGNAGEFHRRPCREQPVHGGSSRRDSIPPFPSTSRGRVP